MPAVQARGVEDVVEGAETHLDIAMGEHADERRHNAEPFDDLWRGAKSEKNARAEDNANEAINEVESASINEPKLCHAVMDGVEAPENWNYMRQAVRPVETEFRRDHTEADLRPKRPIMGPDAIEAIDQWRE